MACTVGFRALAALVLSVANIPAAAQTPPAVAADAERRIEAVLKPVIAWRRDLHEHPELGMQETRTSKLIADHLRSLGVEVQVGVPGAPTAVVGVPKGGKPGPVVALRSDMDGLPVTEQVDLPFKSTAKAQWNGVETGVMHACGHDNHMAILLGAATVLAGMRDQLPGAVKFLFQPAEEGPGGAEPMVKAGVLKNPDVFGLGYPVTRNDPALTERMVPTLKRAAGDANVVVGTLTGTAEDFSYFQNEVPGLFFFLGVTPSSQDPGTAALNHSPLFFADESALPVGVKAMTYLAIDYLFGAPASPR